VRPGMIQRLPDVVCISSIDWDFIWQGHQEIMSTLAARGHRVLFVENTGVRAPQMRDLPRVRQRIRNWWRGTKGFRRERPNLFVYSPIVLPLPYSRIARWINRLFMIGALRRWMRATGAYRPIVWTFLPTPLALDLIHALDPQLTVYYCIDDLASSSPGARRIVSSEQRLFREADLVFVTSEKLRQRAAASAKRVHLFPFGVSFDRFDAVRTDSAAVPGDLAALKRPVVGYVGGLHQWVDQELVAGVADRLPDLSFALVGPAQSDLTTLERCENIHLLGARTHDELPRYVKGFDVGVVPYKIAEYTANVYPTKLNEYLVMGIPVVATDLPEIERFNREHGQIVSVAADAQTFADAIRRALADSTPEERARRVSVAHANSWDHRIAAMQALIDEASERRSQTDQRWDAALKRVYRRARGRAIAVALAVGLLYLAIFQTNTLWWAAAPLSIADAPRQADAIVVFAGGVGESGRAGGGAQERLKQAIDLYRGGYASRLVLSSGFVYSFREAEVMRALAIDQGVPASMIVLEQRATNTYENVRFVDAILRDHGWRSILLVTSPYHMRRALLVWHKQAPEVTVIPTPPAETQFYAHGRGATVDQVRGILQEYLAIAAYWRRGWL
jgi:uncharacterized SAM-binding protein YcdF (DUF218 family)/glycosyltransferase involved in cell wall biosynthesis